MKKMYERLSENLISLARACPFPLYVVGGSVRDYLCGLVGKSADIDLSAPAPAEEFLTCAQKSGFTVDAVYKNTGAVKLSKDGENYEFTSFRSDKYIRGEHVPSAVYFTKDITSDARRRDFKCNAVYYDIKAGEFVDPLGGTEDIKNRIITTVAPPGKVFGEDGLRLMRLARISAETGFTPSGECILAAGEKCLLINDVSPERTAAELKLILNADQKNGIQYAQYRGLEILKDIKVLPILLPELCLGDGMAQRSDFHDHDVLEHSLRAVKYSHPSVRYAALLHDVGKPVCFIKYGNFHAHDSVGAEMSGEILSRLKVPAKESEKIKRLIATHMYDFDCRARESKVRKFIISNFDILDGVLYLKQADYSACKDDLSVAPSVEKIKRIFGKMQAEKIPFTLKQLNIRGDKLIELGFLPKDVGNTLNSLLLDCSVGAVANEEEKLSSFAVKVYGKRGI